MYLLDDELLEHAAAADLRVLAGLPGHDTPARVWLEVVPFLPAYGGAVAKVMRAVYGDDGPPARTSSSTPAARAPRAVPGSDGIVPTAALVGGTQVDASTLLRRAALDDRGGVL